VDFQLAILTAIVNAAVTWGVARTSLAWHRRDIDQLRADVRELQKTLTAVLLNGKQHAAS